MDWEKGEESENLEDRRGMSGRKLAVGGGIGAVIILIIGALLGVNPDQLKRFLGNAPIGEQGAAEQRPLTPQEERTRKFTATILRFTEVVWEEQFRKEGKRYVPPRMGLF